jgi:hypothetical protein
MKETENELKHKQSRREFYAARHVQASKIYNKNKIQLKCYVQEGLSNDIPSAWPSLTPIMLRCVKHVSEMVQKKMK